MENREQVALLPYREAQNNDSHTRASCIRANIQKLKANGDNGIRGFESGVLTISAFGAGISHRVCVVTVKYCCATVVSTYWGRKARPELTRMMGRAHNLVGAVCLVWI